MLGGLATAAIAAVAAAAPDFWLELLYGDQYGSYGYLLRLYAIVYLFIFAGLPLRAGLRAIEHTRTIFIAYLWMTLLTIASAYPLISWLGLTGVLLGALATQLVFILTSWTDLRTRLAPRVS